MSIDQRESHGISDHKNCRVCEVCPSGTVANTSGLTSCQDRIHDLYNALRSSQILVFKWNLKAFLAFLKAILVDEGR